MTVRRLVTLVAALLLAVAACSDDGGSSSTTSPPGTVAPGDVVFGQGELPAAFPAEFPMPASAVVGSTLVTSTRTEVAMVVRQPLEDVVAFFETGLDEAGYGDIAAQEQQFNWTIEFTEPGVAGNIVLTRQDAGITQLVVQLDKE